MEILANSASCLVEMWCSEKEGKWVVWREIGGRARGRARGRTRVRTRVWTKVKTKVDGNE